MLKLDDEITEYIMQTDIFKNIHPNTITFVGIICNLILFFMIQNIKKYNVNMIYFTLLLIVRFLSDCLDGAVARKYKKTSKIGNLLDTISDMMFMYVILYYFAKVYNISVLKITIFFVIILVFMNMRYEIYDNHEIVKGENNNIIDNIFSFSANNTIVIFTAFYLFFVKTK